MSSFKNLRENIIERDVSLISHYVSSFGPKHASNNGLLCDQSFCLRRRDHLGAFGLQNRKEILCTRILLWGSSRTCLHYACLWICQPCQQVVFCEYFEIQYLSYFMHKPVKIIEMIQSLLAVWSSECVELWHATWP